MSDPRIIAIADALAHGAGRGRPRMLEPLEWGRNNRIYKVEFETGPAGVLKSYFRDPRDPRDRLAAEWGFLTYTWARGVRSIPEPLAVDRERGAALYAFASGRKLAAGQVEAAHVDAAIAFVLAINAEPRDAAALAPGSEACFSLEQHLDTVERRVRRLELLDPRAIHAAAAERLVRGTLLPIWSAVRDRIRRDALAQALAMDQDVGVRECCLSPSDFGFHNALVGNDGAVTFLDFEYAGRDDPAKLVSDFFCQPDVRVPIGYHKHFVSRICAGLGLASSAAARCRLLLDAYRVKWACIILNEFLPVGAARRAFADAGHEAEHQIMKAEAMLAEIKAP